MSLHDHVPTPVPADQLWYRHPAADFLDALPLGNGRLGAMTHGGIATERIDLNADTLWSGGPGPRDRAGAAEHLSAVRAAVLRDRDHARADALAAAHLQGPDTEAYQPLATLLLAFPPTEADQVAYYRRELDLDQALHTVSYTADGVAYRRESFVSAPAGVLAIRLTTDAPGSLSFRAGFTTPHPDAQLSVEPDGVLAVRGRAPSHLTRRQVHPADYRADRGTGFAAALRVHTVGGQVGADGDGLAVTGADEAVVLVAVGTGYRGWREQPDGPQAALAEARRWLAGAGGQDYEKLRAEHLADHRRLFGAAALRLHGPAAAADRPTGERLAAANAGAPDPGLAALLFAYGRYLLIASSRPGTQPANLQGIWNTEVAPPWIPTGRPTSTSR
ncbi:glycosyl hydrolase family 65 [Streptomyces sp. TLI_235]|nr:glycoside hydrolase family 95 protein [Streptomyces sp. TLI_235]PBC70348.1 glycosyl hydrolase family 65 [Streptomyces sp. TLI_235]